MVEGVPVHIHDPMNDQGLSDMKCRPSSDEWANWCDENDHKTCGASYFLTEAGVPKRCAYVEGLGKCEPVADTILNHLGALMRRELPHVA